MSAYRRGTVLGLTVAETFILLAFLLLIALLGLIQKESLPTEAAEAKEPNVSVHPWVRPEQIEPLVNAARRARAAAERDRDHAQREAVQARAAQKEAERGRDRAQQETEQARIAREEAEEARDQAQQEAEHARMAQEEAERARDRAQQEAGHARVAQEEAERARDQERRETEQARMAQEVAEQARAVAERDRDQVQRDYALLRRKGENPPCWYNVVGANEGNTREKAHYVFNVAIYEDGIELCDEPPPNGGAYDDGGGPYADEWKRLQIGELPYGIKLSDREFTDVVENLVMQGRKAMVRTYQCVFSVRVWDITPEHAKKRWQHAHDRVIEAYFSAYTVRDDEWKGC